jgi:chemosensory pili system protein ChpA (sensor histidine kinase/response regulator)
MVKGFVSIIEDDLDLGRAVGDVLEMLNFETELVADGSVAFDRIVARMPDLVLLDIHLPGASGVDILNQIRADVRLSKLKVVMVTADALRAEAVSDKADFVLLKPYSISQLSNLITRLIGDKPSV